MTLLLSVLYRSQAHVVIVFLFCEKLMGSTSFTLCSVNKSVRYHGNITTFGIIFYKSAILSFFYKSDYCLILGVEFDFFRHEPNLVCHTRVAPTLISFLLGVHITVGYPYCVQSTGKLGTQRPRYIFYVSSSIAYLVGNSIKVQTLCIQSSFYFIYV